MTPLELKFLIHCNITAEPFPNADAPALKNVIDCFITSGVIEQMVNGNYTTTTKGDKWLVAILRTPMPRQVWVDESGEKL